MSLEAQVDAMLKEFLDLEHASLNLQQATSTLGHAAADSDYLNTVDVITLQVCRAIADAQKQRRQRVDQGEVGNNGDGAQFDILIPNQQAPIVWRSSKASISWIELQTLRRQYMKWIAMYPPNGLGSKESAVQTIAKSFLDYIDTQIASNPT